MADYGLADFGKTGTGKTGTDGYVAPEVIQSEKNGATYTNKCDVWSLGAVLHEIIVGEYLVDDGNNKEQCMNPNQKWGKAEADMKDYVEVCRELLVKDPKKRISASDFVAKIRKITINR